jgi:preprotein translocase subunit SecF
MYNIVKTFKYWTALSISLAIIGALFWSLFWFMWGLKLGIDFTGGAALQIAFPDASQRPAVEEVQQQVTQLGIADPHVQTAGDNALIIRVQQMNNGQREQVLNLYADKQVKEESFSNIGPALGEELKSKSTTAIILVLAAIIAYISYVFRKVSRGPVPSWLFGLGAIMSLIHDLIIVIGIYAALGHFFNIQVDAFFVTALLTILGFSVHDTIVVYDRIRERLKHYPRQTFPEIVNESINSTLARSLNTSLTAVIVLVALYLFGGASIQHFVLALIIGIISGTYSSIFVASPFLLLGQKLLKR